MAEEQKKNDEWKKKCAQTGKALKNVKRYYRNGAYYVNKAAFKAHQEKIAKEAAAAAEGGEE